MRLRDLRWHILIAIILICSYAALVFGFYFPVRGQAIKSLQKLTEENVKTDVQVLTETIESYYERFVVGDVSEFETNFDKTGYASLVNNQPYILAEGSTILKNNDSTLYVFFYNEAAQEDKVGGYIPLTTIIEYCDHSFVIFNDSNGIKYNCVTEAPFGTMNLLLNDDNFFIKFQEDAKDNSYSNIYTVEGEEGVLAVVEFLGYYYGLFVPVKTAIFSVNWVLTQAITFFCVGILIVIIILVIIILGCRKASVLLRVDRHSVENAHSLVIRVKKDGTIIFTNIAFKKLCNLKKLPNLDDFKEVHSNDPIFKYFREKKTIQCYYTNEEKVTKYFQLTPIGVVSTYYLVGSDITEEYLRIQELEALNGKNEYTGCRNNFALSNMYPTIISQTKTGITFIEFSIYKYLDIITLFGTDNYQILLNELLNILKVQFENYDIYQIRDEKFVIVIPDEEVKEVVGVCNQTLALFKKPILVKQNNIYVNMKCVICNLQEEEKESIHLSEVKRRIELAYQAINGYSGKDLIIYDPAMEGVISARMQLEEDLKVAIEEKKFIQYLQPQFNVVTNRIVGFESLIRWDDPKYLSKSPQQFIELAEQKGYILDISRFVVDNTFKLAKLLEDYDVTISMNLSAIQIIQVGFVSELKSKFDEYQLRPGSIALEITETFLMENFALVNEKLKVLQKEGFKIHLDDFGTGYSSMAYLKDLPVDTIKIDYQFTQYVDTNKVNYSIVSCISTLAKELGLDVIVEGVETKSQQDVVKKLGCRIIQGYLIGRPMPYDDALSLLEKYNVK